jgi:hypothetical protein
MSFNHLEEEAYEFCKEFKRISSCLFMRKYKLNFEHATNLCNKITLRRHLEAREMRKDIEND